VVLRKIHVQVVGCELRQKRSGPSSCTGAGRSRSARWTEQKQFAARRHTEILGKVSAGARIRSSETTSAPMDVTRAPRISSAMLRNLEGGCACRVAGSAHESCPTPAMRTSTPLVAEFAQRRGLAVMRDTPNDFYDVVFRTAPGRTSAPLAGADIVQDMALHLEVEGVEVRPTGLSMASRISCIDRYSQPSDDQLSPIASLATPPPGPARRSWCRACPPGALVRNVGTLFLTSTEVKA